MRQMSLPFRRLPVATCSQRVRPGRLGVGWPGSCHRPATCALTVRHIVFSSDNLSPCRAASFDARPQRFTLPRMKTRASTIASLVALMDPQIYARLSPGIRYRDL
ncbi:hypothetical protein CYLTODRAFT_419942, partial [Cylindrobasidium torrendii FP15055 ss-10]